MRIGRPPCSKPASKAGDKKGGARKRKKRRQLFIHRKKHNNLKPESPEQKAADAAQGGQESGSGDAEAKRREVLHSAKKPLVSRAKALLDSAKRTKVGDELHFCYSRDLTEVFLTVWNELHANDYIKTHLCGYVDGKM